MLDRVAEEKNIKCKISVGLDYNELKELKEFIDFTLNDESSGINKLTNDYKVL